MLKLGWVFFSLITLSALNMKIYVNMKFNWMTLKPTDRKSTIICIISNYDIWTWDVYIQKLKLQFWKTKTKQSRLPGTYWWWVGRCPGRWQSVAGIECWRPGLRSVGCLAACPPPLWWPYGCPCWGPSAARSSCHTLPCNSARRAQLQEGAQVGRNLKLYSNSLRGPWLILVAWYTGQALTFDVGCNVEKKWTAPLSNATGWAKTIGLLSVMRTASLSEEPLISSCKAFRRPIRVRKYATWWKSEPASSYTCQVRRERARNKHY